jgi:hypothetical protein
MRPFQRHSLMRIPLTRLVPLMEPSLEQPGRQDLDIQIIISLPLFCKRRASKRIRKGCP